jgi:Putative metal-binding motif
MHRLIPLLLLACHQSPGFSPSEKDTGGEEDEGGGADGADGGSDGSDDGDIDGDGFTVEDGDCDDEDIGANPAREEETGDGVDNDCDGRVDEEWKGMTVAEQRASGRSALVRLDSVGREEEEIILPEDTVPYDIDHGVDGGYVITATPLFINISAGLPSFEYEAASLIEVDEGGTATTLATFEDEAYAEKFYWYGPLLTGVATHPDGWYAVSTPGALYRVDPDGTQTELASWAWDITDDATFELYALDLAVDLQTGEIGIMDLLGGFATWSEAGGLSIHKKADLSDGWENWDAKLGMGLTHMGGEGYYGLVGDFTSGEYALYTFDRGAGDWTTTMDWANDLLLPIALCVNTDEGDLYATAKGGDHRTIWRLRGVDSSVDDFRDEVEDGKTWWGVVGNYY